MADALDSLHTAVAGITALYAEGDPSEILSAVLVAPTSVDQAAIASALTLLASRAMHEIDRLDGEGAGVEWLQAEALRLEQ